MDDAIEISSIIVVLLSILNTFNHSAYLCSHEHTVYRVFIIPQSMMTKLRGVMKFIHCLSSSKVSSATISD